MKKHPSVSDLIGLSVAERILFVEDVWDSVAAVPEQVELSPELKRELDERIEDYEKNPQDGSPWEEVRERIRGYR